MRPLRLAIYLVASLALLAPSALAASAQGELQAGALHLSPDATLASPTLDLLSKGKDAPTVDLSATTIDVQRFGSTIVGTDAAGGFHSNTQQIDDRASYAGARMTLATGSGEQLAAIRTLGPATATIGGATVRGVGGALLAQAQQADQGGKCADADCLDVFGVYGIDGSATAQVTGELTLILYGPTLHLVAADGTTKDYASGVTHVQDAGPAAETQDAWVVLHAKGVSGSVASTIATLYTATPTMHASQVRFQDAHGALNVGAKDYRASGDDVTAIGAIILQPSAVAPAADHGINGETVYASSVSTRVSGDVQSVDLRGSIAFLDTPAKQAGFAAVVAALVVGLAYGWQHLTFGFAALYTRLNKPEILENDVRNHIYEIIRLHPGISAREVHRQSNQSWGTVVYHLRQLERHHLVVSRAIGRTRNYYENHGKYKGMEAQLACLQSDRALVLARAIVTNPGITQEQLAILVHFPQPTTSYYVRKLKQAGLVEEQRDGRYAKYVPHADLPRYIQLSESSVTTAAPAGAGVQA